MKETPEFSILLADDSELAINNLKQILGRQYILYTAKSGKETLKKALENRPDLILLDIIMPDMSGLEVLARIKKSNIINKIPVIFITGLDSIEDEEKGLLLGAVDYISKPFHGSIVKARVRTHLEIVRQIRAIERFGMIDPLTDIPNRRSFDSQINIEWAKAAREKTPISMLLLDIDGFKAYNDTYGHVQGDMLLRILSKTFTSTLKDTTDLIFRWGGDEFAVLLPNTGSAEAFKIAETIRINVEAAMIPNVCDGRQTFITVSVGVVSMTPSKRVVSDMSETDLFTSEADKALYAAKNSGRNRCICIESY